MPKPSLRCIAEGVATACPEDCARLVVLGEPVAQAAFAATFARLRPNATLFFEPADDAAALDLTPIPHASAAEDILARRAPMRDARPLFALFRSGEGPEAMEAFCAARWAPPGLGDAAPLGEFSRLGVEITLSRAELIPTEWFDVPDADGAPWGWLVCAAQRPSAPSPRRTERDARRDAAAQCNAQGEALFAQGDYRGALNAFALAIGHWNGEAVYFNNMATLLCAMGAHDDAWTRILDAMHLDPSSPNIRENLSTLAHLLGHQAEAETLLALFPERQDNAEDKS